MRRVHGAVTRETRISPSEISRGGVVRTCACTVVVVGRIMTPLGRCLESLRLHQRHPAVWCVVVHVPMPMSMLTIISSVLVGRGGGLFRPPFIRTLARCEHRLRVQNLHSHTRTTCSQHRICARPIRHTAPASASASTGVGCISLCRCCAMPCPLRFAHVRSTPSAFKGSFNQRVTSRRQASTPSNP